MRNENRSHFVKEITEKKCRLKWYYVVLITILAVTFFCTVYFLINPAMTLEETQEMLECMMNVHQHTAECRDENGTLICGQADFVIHTHNENCYNADDRLICNLTEIAAHEHTDDCYETQQVLICTSAEEGHIHGDDCYQTERKLVCSEMSVLHTHDDNCYDENGLLICGILQVTEHTHSSECFRTAEETAEADTTVDVMTEITTTNDVVTETTTADDVMAAVEANDIMLMSETEKNVIWGYNDDGSMWWNTDAAKQQITYENIKVDVPYVLAGYQGRNVLTNVVTNVSGKGDKLSTVRPSTDAAYGNYEIWYFEKVGDTADKYYIHDNNEQYVKMERTNTYLTDKGGASVFTVNQLAENQLADCDNCITIYSETEGNYINIAGSDDRYCKGYWEGWSGLDNGSCLQVLKLTSEHRTAELVDITPSPNTVINLFDYWTSDDPAKRYERDNTAADLNAGINNGHALKFVHGDQPDTDELNLYTGWGQNPRQGIVQNKLNDNRYPVLSGEFQGEENSNESLEYLFNPVVVHPGKKSYKNVDGLLSTDDQGYHIFDSGRYAAEFNEESNSFNVYDTHDNDKQFFPFNKAPEVMTISHEDAKINHYFGATLTTRFVQQNGGYVDSRRLTPTTFEFSGDDDVWIFIDDVLIGDVGGIHDKASVAIDFATGAVEVRVIGGNVPITTTLKKCYEDAGKYKPEEWIEENGHTIYKDNTVHTLKFFYLERGNYESNMKLRYNLTAIPQTAIYKVNQYDEAVQGATFAVYAADSDYNMLSEKGGAPVNVSSGSEIYDEITGDLVDGEGNVIANALYTGTTDKNGEMIFIDQDSMPYSINELQDMFGDHFILREIKVPDGYRVVSKDVNLRIWTGESQKILMCDNTMESGSRAAPNMQITATDTLHLYSPYNGSNTVEFCDEQGNTNGMLFAVIFRYTGNIDKNGNATEVNDGKKWIPVYGNDKDGYQMIEINGDAEPGLEEVLLAARHAREYGSNIFELSDNGTIQLTLNNLPGHISTYYHMLGIDNKEQARYTVAYYWTDCTSLEEATVDRIHRVDSTAGTTSGGNQYSGFKLVYGANIHVPNLINEVFVQKVDEENKLLNGASFAIYKVEQSENGTINYFSVDGSLHALSENAVISTDGVITDGDICIKPLTTQITKNCDDGIHTGTAEFTNLSDGQYIIKEVDSPPGYKLNTADVMVLVTEDIIYANAGTKDDGITVGRGPGYLVTPLSQFASEGQIDNTLTWVYAQMKISNESKSFADVGDENMIKGYVSKNYSDETTTDESNIFRTYLKYAKENEKKAFNYVPDEIRNKGLDSDGYRRVFTTVGWSYYEIYQDYNYGKAKADADGANYEDWRGINLTHLFSRSTYIRVTDEREPTLRVKKADAANKETVLPGAEFRIFKMQNDGAGTDPVTLYYCRNNDTLKVGWSENPDEAFIVTTNMEGIADGDFTCLSDGEYYLEEVTPPEGYSKLSKPVKFIFSQGALTLDPETTNGGKNASAETDAVDKNLSIVMVYNNAAFMLPATGGCGTLPYTMVGILLISVPLMYVFIKNRRSKRIKEYR